MKLKILTLATMGALIVGCGGDGGDGSSGVGSQPNSPLPPQQTSLQAVFPEYLLDQTATDQMQVILSGNHNFVVGAVNKQAVQIVDESNCSGKLTFSATGSDFVEKLNFDMNIGVLPTTIYIKPNSASASNCYHKISVSSGGEQIIKDDIAVGDYIIENDALLALDKVSSFSKLVIQSAVGETTLKKIMLNSIDHDKTSPLKVEIGEGYEDVGEKAFQGYEISELILPSTLKNINELAFAETKNISLVSFPDGIRNISISSFNNAGLKGTVSLPTSLSLLGCDAFANNKIEKVVFNSNIIHEGDDESQIKLNCFAFINNDIAEVVYQGEANRIKRIGAGLFQSNKLRSINLPRDIKEIGQSAFANNQIESLNFPEGLEKIERRAFSDNKFTSVKLPSTLREVDGFEDNPNLKYVDLNMGLEIINDGAFYRTSITKFVIPSTVIAVARGAFPLSGEKVCFQSKNPPQKLNTHFTKNGSLQIILMHPDADVNAWKEAGWDRDISKGDCSDQSQVENIPS